MKELRAFIEQEDLRGAGRQGRNRHCAVWLWFASCAEDLLTMTLTRFEVVLQSYLVIRYYGR